MSIPREERSKRMCLCGHMEFWHKNGPCIHGWGPGQFIPFDCDCKAFEEVSK